MGENDEYNDDIDYDELEAERRKQEVGMAEFGTGQYYRNAYYILKSYTKPNSETRAKLKWLEEHGYDS
jgi:hypothetical protein